MSFNWAARNCLRCFEVGLFRRRGYVTNFSAEKEGIDSGTSGQGEGGRGVNSW